MAAAAASPRPALAQVTDAGRAAMAGAATAFLGALPDDARRRAVIAFADKERFNWHYVPRGREGLPFKAMPAPARAAAHELMKASLSAVGYAKAVNVIRLETVLRQLETFGGLLRDAENYSVTVFGAPDSTAAPWGWRLEGHHLSLNFTLVPGKPVAVTPAFFGANPAEVRSGPLKGLRTLAREQDLGRALAQSMDAAQRRRMTISAQSLGDIVSGPGRAESLASQVGLPAVDLAPPQRELLVQLVEEYARNMRPDLADEHLRRIREAGVERIHFAWAGPIDPGHAHYYRIHGPTVLIELDNTQNDANHIHSVWHDPAERLRRRSPARALRARPPAPARLSRSRRRPERRARIRQLLDQEGRRTVADARSYPYLWGLGQWNELARLGARGKAWPSPSGHRRLLLASDQSPVRASAATRGAGGTARIRARAVAVLGVVGVSMRVGRPSHSGVRLGRLSCRPNARSADPPASARGRALRPSGYRTGRRAARRPRRVP